MTRIYAPGGVVGEPPRELARSPEMLSGLRLGILDNGKPNADVLMRRIAERLVERTGVSLALDTRKGTAATPCEPELLAELEKGVDLVLTGSAD